MLSADTGAITREANSEEGSDSETDEEEFPTSQPLKVLRYTSPSCCEETELADALTTHGAAVLAQRELQ